MLNNNKAAYDDHRQKQGQLAERVSPIQQTKVRKPKKKKKKAAHTTQKVQ